MMRLKVLLLVGCIALMMTAGFALGADTPDEAAKKKKAETKAAETKAAETEKVETKEAETDKGELRVLKKGFIIAASQELFNQAIKLLMAKDEAGLRELMSGGLVGVTKEGGEVYVLRLHLFIHMAEVTPKNESAVLWISIEALE